MRSILTPSACNATSCTGTGFARLDMAYDALGHRITLTETPAAGTATVTAFTYAGDVVVRETSTTGTTTVTRTFTTDEAGAIVKLKVAGLGATDDGDYLVTWNGHGDAVELSRIDADTGALAPANRFGYDTWGTPTLTTVGGFGDLGFRYRYVGRYDVQWDSSTAVPAGLLYMHARHYHPEFVRFLQPDPSALEANPARPAHAPRAGRDERPSRGRAGRLATRTTTPGTAGEPALAYNRAGSRLTALQP